MLILMVLGSGGEGEGLGKGHFDLPNQMINLSEGVPWVPHLVLEKLHVPRLPNDPTSRDEVR